MDWCERFPDFVEKYLQCRLLNSKKDNFLLGHEFMPNLWISRPRLVSCMRLHEILRSNEWQCRSCGHSVRVRKLGGLEPFSHLLNFLISHSFATFCEKTECYRDNLFQRGLGVSVLWSRLEFRWHDIWEGDIHSTVSGTAWLRVLTFKWTQSISLIRTKLENTGNVLFHFFWYFGVPKLWHSTQIWT